jgi:hypothetical protein
MCFHSSTRFTFLLKTPQFLSGWSVYLSSDVKDIHQISSWVKRTALMERGGWGGGVGA